jgi:hypothetical protein
MGGTVSIVARNRPGATRHALYPLSVLVLIFLFPTRLDIVAAAWGILPPATAWRRLRARTSAALIPWNRDKTVADRSPCGCAAAWPARRSHGGAGSVSRRCGSVVLAGRPVVPLAVAALAETLPIRLDINVTVPMTAAGVL